MVLQWLWMSDFQLNPGPLSFGLGPQSYFVWTQLAPGEKQLVCISGYENTLDTQKKRPSNNVTKIRLLLLEQSDLDLNCFYIP